MKKFYLFALLGLLGCASFAQQTSKPDKPVFYQISFPNAAHHEADISMTVPAAPFGSFKVRMSRSSAGRYATHEFGKNVYSVKAHNTDGKPVEITQLEGDVWEIDRDHGDAVIITYTLFANHTDGTYASVDDSHAHLNMPAAFMWVPGLEMRPVKFEFNDLDKYGWKVATQLKHEGENIYSAPNMQYMMDSPTELSKFNEVSWMVTNPDSKKQKINLTVHSDDDQATIDNFSTMVKKVVLEEQAVYGELPAYDYGEYTFLDDVYPSNSGDGMEHRNSTCIVATAPRVAGLENRLISTYAHEYFHSWNVKRIRPKTLEPFNFEHADMSSELWFAEGFTQYYGQMLLVRAGIVSPEDYARNLSGLVSATLSSPGAKKYPATQMSRDAVFTDAGVSIDPNNNANTFLSYYTYGGAIAVALDLTLRENYNLTLDDYMRQVWLDLGKNTTPFFVKKPYLVSDLQTELAKLTKNPKFATEFFGKYITGTEKADYATLLEKAGYVLRKTQPGKAWIGNLGGFGGGRNRAGQAPAATSGGFTVPSNTLEGSPIYKAGIDVADVILTADGKNITSAADLNDVVAAKKPGDKINVTFKSRTGQHETTITAEENPAMEVVTAETAGKTLTKEQADFRIKWLSSKAKLY
jgi:predicted metalloprotease with PDZ domain